MSNPNLNSEDEMDTDQASYLTLVVSSQVFCIPVGEVQDVFTPGAITAVPLAPPEVGGVLNLRGRIVTIIDLRRRLALLPAAGEQSAMAVGVERQGESYGLLVDRVGEVMSLDQSKIEPNPENLDRAWSEVSKGVYRLPDTLMVVLDMNRLMSFERDLRAA